MLQRERGEVNIGCVISLIILALAIIIAVKVVPALVNMGDFQSEAEALAERATLPRHTNDFIRGQLAFKAQQLHVPVPESAIKVERGGQEIHIHAEYDYTVDLIVTTYTWHRVVDVRRPLF